MCMEVEERCVCMTVCVEEGDVGIEKEGRGGRSEYGGGRNEGRHTEVCGYIIGEEVPDMYSYGCVCVEEEGVCVYRGGKCVFCVCWKASY